jgi:hypothetical protein
MYTARKSEIGREKSLLNSVWVGGIPKRHLRRLLFTWAKPRQHKDAYWLILRDALETTTLSNKDKGEAEDSTF